jgi:hypothetical protein
MGDFMKNFIFLVLMMFLGSVVIAAEEYSKSYTRSPLPGKALRDVRKVAASEIEVEEQSLIQFDIDFYDTKYGEGDKVIAPLLADLCWGQCSKYRRDSKFKIEKYMGKIDNGHWPESRRTSEAIRQAVMKLAADWRIVYFYFTDGSEKDEAGALLVSDTIPGILKISVLKSN